jgi:hypothetical protein
MSSDMGGGSEKNEDLRKPPESPFVKRDSPVTLQNLYTVILST